MIQKNHINIFNQRLFNFWISVYYGLLSLSISNCFFWIYQQIHLPLNSSLFIFSSIAAYYYYQKEIAPVYFHQLNKNLTKLQLTTILFLAILSLYFFIRLNFEIQATVACFFIVGIAYHNHTKFFIFRKLLVWKNIVISICWTGICLMSFNLNHLGQLNLWLIAMGFFILVFIQSVLFDFIDIDKDKQYGHQTLALALIPDKLFQLTQNLGLLLAFILLSVTFLGKLSIFGFLLNICLLSVYYSKFFLFIKSHHPHLIYFTDIIFLLFSAGFLI